MSIWEVTIFGGAGQLATLVMMGQNCGTGMTRIVPINVIYGQRATVSAEGYRSSLYHYKIKSMRVL